MFSKLKLYSRMSALRLAFSLTAMFVILLGLVWIVTSQLVKFQLYDRLETEMTVRIFEIEQGEFEPNDDLDFQDEDSELWGIRDQDRTEGFFPKRFEDREEIFDFTHDGKDYIGLVLELEDGAYFLGWEDDEISFTLALLNSAFSVSVMLALAFASWIGIFFGLRTQKRLNQISNTLGDLADGNLRARTGLRGNDDIGNLAARLDETAEKLEILVTQTRNLGANIAHDLRTPLARIRANLEQASRGEDGALERAQVEAEELSEIFAAIMRIARIEAATGKENFVQLRLGTLANDVFEIFAPVVEDSGKTLKTSVERDAEISLDRQLVVQALANLIQNAITYGGENVTIFAHGTEIGVYDDGLGVDPNEFDRILQPMVRLDTTRQSQGAGLGLALVRAVGDRHKAKVAVARNSPQGLKVSLDFSS